MHIKNTDEMDSVMYTISILQKHNMDLIASTKTTTRSQAQQQQQQQAQQQQQSLADESITKLEVFTNNCLMIAKLKSTFRRLHAIEAMKYRAAASAKAKIEAEHDMAFSVLCDAIEPKFGSDDVDLSFWTGLKRRC
jgi:hypothetical protein